MILAARKHLYAINIFFFFVIFIVQKLIKIFCIIEEKACKNANCPTDKRCDERCVAPTATDAVASAASVVSLAAGLTISSASTKVMTSSSAPPSPTSHEGGLSLIPKAMRKTMRNFGFGEGHFQIFVEEKQRHQYMSKPSLNAAFAEVKLNPN
uniref:Uncharacterized protein n=1 Tax=Stomoxys calcitrans TaxID=35570 RepID=A0A1I8PD42_STOCA